MEMTMKRKYKITLTPGQLEVVRLIQRAKKRSVYFWDDEAHATIDVDGAVTRVDMNMFNALEMIGLFGVSRHIGSNIHRYPLNTSILQKVANL